MKSVLDMSEDERTELIKAARQSEDCRRPDPQGEYTFAELGWLPFSVVQQGARISLCTYRQKQKGPLKALAFMFHGLGSHINRGAHLAHYFAEAGIMTVGFDHRGFGKSQGIRGYIQDYEQLLEDSLQFYEKVTARVREEVGKLPPVFLIGLSMGGLTSFRLSFKLKVRGCILYAPAFAPFTGSFLVGLGKFLGFLLPKTTVEKESDPTGSRNPAVTERSRKDPNATLFSPFGTLRSLLNAMEGSESLFGQMETPFVLVAGGRDKLVRLSSHEEMFRRAGTQDKQFWFYEEMWHDVYHEQEIEDILPKSRAWMLKRAQQ